MKIFSPIKDFFKRLNFRIRLYFYSKYIGIYELITLKLLATVSKMVRKLILIKGRDPDYVAPAPLPPAEPTAAEVVDVAIKSRPQINIPYVPAWVRASFKNKSEHPVIKSRDNLNLRPNPNPYDLTGSKVIEKAPEVEVETLQVTISGSLPEDFDHVVSFDAEPLTVIADAESVNELVLESDAENKLH